VKAKVKVQGVRKWEKVEKLVKQPLVTTPHKFFFF
jgi:hypothetical protein